MITFLLVLLQMNFKRYYSANEIEACPNKYDDYEKFNADIRLKKQPGDCITLLGGSYSLLEKTYLFDCNLTIAGESQANVNILIKNVENNIVITGFGTSVCLANLTFNFEGKMSISKFSLFKISEGAELTLKGCVLKGEALQSVNVFQLLDAKSLNVLNATFLDFDLRESSVLRLVNVSAINFRDVFLFNNTYSFGSSFLEMRDSSVLFLENLESKGNIFISSTFITYFFFNGYGLLGLQNFSGRHDSYKQNSLMLRQSGGQFSLRFAAIVLCEFSGNSSLFSIADTAPLILTKQFLIKNSTLGRIFTLEFSPANDLNVSMSETLITNCVMQGSFFFLDRAQNIDLKNIIVFNNNIYEPEWYDEAWGLISINSVNNSSNLEFIYFCGNAISVYSLIETRKNDINFILKDSVIINNQFENQNQSYSSLVINLEFCGSVQLLNNLWIINTLAKYTADGLLTSFETKTLIINASSFFGNSGPLKACILIFLGESLIIFNTSFIENESVLEGSKGMIIICSSVSIDRVYYMMNYASLGAFLNFIAENLKKKTPLQIALSNLQIKNNSAKESLIYFSECYELNFSLTDTIAVSNEVLYTGGFFKANYDGIRQKNYFFIFERCSFSFHRALKAGVCNIAARAGNFTFSNCIFFSNYVKSTGGVFGMYADVYANLYTNSCIFLDNVSNRGGVLFIVVGNYFDENSVFIGNFALTASTLASGYKNKLRMSGSYIIFAFSVLCCNIMLVQNVQAEIFNTTFQACSCLKANSGVSTYNNASLKLDKVKFKGNVAITGAAIRISRTTSSAIIKNCDFLNNNASSSLIMVTGGSLMASSLFFDTNYGALLLITNSEISISSSQIKRHNCLNDQQEGCLAFVRGNSSVLLRSINISEIISERSNILKVILLSYSRMSLEGFGLSNIPLSSPYFNNSNRTNLFYLSKSMLLIANSTIFSNDKSLIEATQSEIEISNTLFKTIKPDSPMPPRIAPRKILLSSVLFIIDSNLTVSGSSFSKFTDSAIKSRRASSASDSKFFIRINKSEFYFNKGNTSGGALLLSGLMVRISNCTFFANEAMLSGGAIFIECPLLNCEIYINSSVFKSNTANISGGAIYWKDQEIKQQLNEFFFNSAGFGNEISSEPLYIFPEFDLSDIKNKAFLIYSGIRIKYAFNFTIRDFHNQVVLKNTALPKLKVRLETSYDWDEPPVYLDSFSTFSALIGETMTNPDGEGNYIFSEITLIGTPTKAFSLIFESDILKQYKTPLVKETQFFKYCFNSLNPLYCFNLTLNFDSCKEGQIFDSKRNLCRECPIGEFSLFPPTRESVCQTCPENAFCRGGSDISVLPGYWRSKKSSVIYKCKKSFACKGGNDSICIDGYVGTLCDTCSGLGEKANSKDIYFLGVNRHCWSCQSDERLKGNLLVFGILLILILYITILIKNKLASKNSFIDVMFKIFTDYVQVTSGYVQILPDSWKNLFSMQAHLSNPNTLMSTLDCSFSGFAVSLNIFFKKLLIGGLVGIMIPLAILSFWFIYYLKRKEAKSHMWLKIKISLVVSFYTLQPNFLRLFLGGLTCTKYEDRYYLSEYMLQECWTDSHDSISYYLLLPFLFTWMIIVPIFLLISSLRARTTQGESSKISKVRNLSPHEEIAKIKGSASSDRIFSFRKNKILSDLPFPPETAKRPSQKKEAKSGNQSNNSSSFFDLSEGEALEGGGNRVSKRKGRESNLADYQLTEENLKRQNSYINYGFKKKFFYWEFIIMIKKYILLLLITFLISESSVVFLLLFVNFFFLLIQVTIKPYCRPILNRVAYWSLTSCFSTVVFLSLQDVYSNQFLVIFYVVALFAIHSYFLLLWLATTLAMNKRIVEIWNKHGCFFKLKALQQSLSEIKDSPQSRRYGKIKSLRMFKI